MSTEPQLYEITVTCLTCGSQWATWWTAPGDQDMPGCGACTPGFTDRVPMRKK